MTARPIDPECRRRPVYAAVALVLVLVAVLLAAGCESPGLANPTFPLQEEKYVLLQQNTDYNATTISGHCLRMNSDYWYDYSFDEKTGNLSVHPVLDKNEPVNDSLLLYYGDSGSEKQGPAGNVGGFVYSVPRQINPNVTIESINGEGTVRLRYDDVPIILKPKTRWENITHKKRYTPPLQNPISDKKMPDGAILIGEDSFECTEDIIITNSIYNAGVFDKKRIVLPIPKNTPEPAFRFSANQFMNWTVSHGKP